VVAGTCLEKKSWIKILEQTAPTAQRRNGTRKHQNQAEKYVASVHDRHMCLTVIAGIDKKVAFADDKPARPSKKAKTTSNAAEQTEKLSAAKAKESRKRAADFFDDPTEKLAPKDVDEAPVKPKKAKTASTKETAAAVAPATTTKKVKATKITTESLVTSKKAKGVEINKTPLEVEEAEVAPGKVKKAAKEALVKSKKVRVIPAAEEEVKEAPVKSKEVKNTQRAAEVISTSTSISTLKSSKEINGEKSSKTKNAKAVIKASDFEELAIVDSSSEGEDNIADQTAALLAGFDSSSDEGEDDAVPLDQVPKANISKKARKALEAAKNDTPGTVYVG
jgi:hypothetical protein